jgi:hypothetical protein
MARDEDTHRPTWLFFNILKIVTFCEDDVLYFFLTYIPCLFHDRFDVRGKLCSARAN